MPHIALFTVSPDKFQTFSTVLSAEPGIVFEMLNTRDDVLRLARNGSPDLIIVDDKLPDCDPFYMIKRIIGVNALINTAVLSSLSDEDFHEKSEGLGILCRLPPKPGKNEAETLLQKLRGVMELAWNP